MIFICEYDGTLSPEVLLKKAEKLPITLPANLKPDAGDRKWEAARQRIIAWLMLKEAWRRTYGQEFPTENLVRAEHGKPYLMNMEQYFNLSHCDVACACVISENPCGIDIERRFSGRLSLAKRVCHEKEWQKVEQMTEAEKEIFLQKLWSMKESYVKYTGTGITVDIREFDFSGNNPFTDHENLPVTDGICVQEEKYTLAVCGKNINTTMNIICESELR